MGNQNRLIFIPMRLKDALNESVNEGKYYVTYNKGRGQGKGLEKEFDQKSFSSTDKPKVFNSYNDAKKYAEKMEKMFQHSIGGGTAYWVSDEKMNPIKESVTEEKVYIDFLNKAKGFKQDRIKFNSYEDAVKWAKKNFDKFDRDMIKYESVNEAVSKNDIEKLTTYKDLSKFIKANKSKINSKDFMYIEDEVEALKYLESDYKRGKADRQEVEVAVIDAQDSIKRAMGIKVESVNEGRELKSIQSDLNKTIVAIQSEISSYKATKGTPQEKKHVDNLKKLHPIKKKLESELESAVSGLYRDAELKIED